MLIFINLNVFFQGTARNVHYTVLRNDLQLSIDNIENFVFRTCFNSVRSREISFLPIALKYVDLLAFRGKEYSEANAILNAGSPNREDNCHKIHDNIKNQLFYC